MMIGSCRGGTVVGTVLVTGGTGTLGRAVVAELRAREQAVRVLSRRPPGSGPAGLEGVDWVTGDLRCGAGLDRAVRDAAIIVHCATDVRRPRRDVEGTHNLLAAACAAGAPHLVYVSIVGEDRVPLPYYRTKLEVEQLVEASRLPWTVLRATQFHDLVASALRVLTRPPVVLLPTGTACQPVDVRVTSPRDWSSWLSLRPTGEPPTSADRRCGPSVISLGPTCTPSGVDVPSGRYPCPERSPAVTGRAATSPPRAQLLAARSRTTSSSRQWCDQVAGPP